MADSLGIRLGVEGEREFRNALRDINQSFRVLGSEMQLVTSEFGRNERSVGSLTARNQVLNREIDTQKEKLSTLERAVASATESFGENDRRTQAWVIQLNNARAELNNMEREVRQNEDAINEMGNQVEGSSLKFDKFGSVLKGVGVAMGAIVVAASAAAIELGKEIVSAYADYEQLVGGIDTLFKDSSAEMQKYASNAYKTAGMSANEYMETVTSFSASLISSLGGDTEKAVDYANMAITDMSDNANKMGSSMESIQNAYQGFAKQNYGMLDNLKLGYGGSKTEMERLLKDAEAISGVKYDVSSYADVVSAIHEIQESMGVAGATALEAESTITGSIDSLQAAFSNLVIGFGDSNADMEQLTTNVVDAFKNVVTNIIPIIENIVSALPGVIDAILLAITENLPMLVESATAIVMTLVEGLIQSLPQITDGALQLFLGLVNGILDNLPQLIDAALQMVLTLALGIVDALPELIPAIIETVVQIVDVLLQNMDKILDGAFKIITGLADGLVQAIPILMEALPQIIESFVSFFIGNLPKFIELGVLLNVELTKGLIKAIPQIVAQLPQIITAIINGFKSGLTQFEKVGKSMLEGVWEGIKSMKSWLKDQVTGLFTDLVTNVKQTLKINSPSKVFAEIGGYMGEGVGVGFADSIGETKTVVISSMNDLVTSVLGVQKQANEKITKEQEAANKKAISLIKDAAKKQYDAEKEAVKDGLDGKLDIISDKLEKEVSLYDDASSSKIKLYDEEYLKKIELIDEATGLSLQGINDEIEKELEKLQITNKGLYDEITARREKIAMIEAEGEAEKENQRIKRETAKLEELQSKVYSATDYEELRDAQKALATYKETLATEQRERDRKAQIEQLNTEIKGLQDTAKAGETAFNDMYKNQKEQQEKLIKEFSTGLSDNAESDIKKITDGYTLFVDTLENGGISNVNLNLDNFKEVVLPTEIVTQINSDAVDITANEWIEGIKTMLEDIGKIFKKDESNWFDAGQTFGNQLLSGLQNVIPTINSVIDNVSTKINEAIELQKELNSLSNSNTYATVTNTTNNYNSTYSTPLTIGTFNNNSKTDISKISNALQKANNSARYSKGGNLLGTT